MRFDQGLQCFKWSVLAAGHQVLKDNSSQSNLLELNRNELEGSHGEPGIFPTFTFNCFEGKWPIKINDISKWEQENASALVGICVLHYNELEKTICPIRAPSNSNVKYYTYLLYGESDNADHGHFWPIVNLCRLLSSGKTAQFYCPYCLSPSRTEDKLKHHIEACSPHGLQTVSMPKGEKAIIEFKDFCNKMPFQYRIFADFESIIKKVDEPIRKGIISERRPAAYAHTVVKYGKKLEQYRETYGLNCHIDGMILLTQDAQNCLDEIYDTCHEMIITEKIVINFKRLIAVYVKNP